MHCAKPLHRIAWVALLAGLTLAVATGCSEWKPETPEQAVARAEEDILPLASQDDLPGVRDAFAEFLTLCDLPEEMEQALLDGQKALAEPEDDDTGDLAPVPSVEAILEALPKDHPKVIQDDGNHAILLERLIREQAAARANALATLDAWIEFLTVPAEVKVIPRELVAVPDAASRDPQERATLFAETLAVAQDAGVDVSEVEEVDLSDPASVEEALNFLLAAMLEAGLEPEPEELSDREIERREEKLAVVQHRLELLDELEATGNVLVQDLTHERAEDVPNDDPETAKTKGEELNATLGSVVADLRMWLESRQATHAIPEPRTEFPEVALDPNGETAERLQTIRGELSHANRELAYMAEISHGLANKLVYYKSPSAWPSMVWVILIIGILLFYGTLLFAIVYSMLKSGDAPKLPEGEPTGLVHHADDHD